MAEVPLPRRSLVPAALYGAAVVFFFALLVFFIGRMLGDESRTCSSNFSGDGVICTGGNDFLSYLFHGALISLAGSGLYLSNRAFRMHGLPDEVFAPYPRPGIVWTIVVILGTFFFASLFTFLAVNFAGGGLQACSEIWQDDQLIQKSCEGYAQGVYLAYAVFAAITATGVLVSLFELRNLFRRWRVAW